MAEQSLAQGSRPYPPPPASESVVISFRERPAVAANAQPVFLLIEGAVYGLVMAAIALGSGLTNQFGSWLYDFFGPTNQAHHYSVVHGWDWSLYIGLA